jgi:hypothetical protein
MMPTDWLWLDFKHIVEEALSMVEENDTGHRFSISRINEGKKSSKASFIAYCSLSNIQERTRAAETTKFVRKQTLYNCKGIIKEVIDMERSAMEISCRHEVQHAHPEQESRSDPEVIEHNVRLAAIKDVAAILKDTKNRYPTLLRHRSRYITGTK